ncbi:MAG TPA: ribosome small subunit-dependent GTPase A [Candidatus Caccomorpha excrementavium]|nr:ribosome small subunit-dependent GTPase A [Candidatus Caccomorpha excrementavium]
MTGKIIKGVAGFYYVYTESCKEVECRARGIFRNRNEKPLVGDNVELEILDEKTGTGNITRLLKRRNELIRPAAANIDQAAVIFAAACPSPNRGLLDRFLIMMERENIKTIICINKSDLEEKTAACLKRIYTGAGYEVLIMSMVTGAGIARLKELLKGKTTILAGPSGVGKSTLTNQIQPGARMETGQVSEKIQRGRHTTRHTEIIPVDEETFLLDTPGFSSLYLPDMDKEELKEYFPEFAPYAGQCRFGGCAHLEEPDCAVKNAAGIGLIGAERYESYRQMYEELKNKKRY